MVDTVATNSRGLGAARLVVLGATQFLLVLDSAIVNVALPRIRADLGFSPAGISWVVNGYALAFGGLLLLGGRSSDLYGPRRVFVTGLSLFAAASVAGALAPSAGVLVAARVVQGVGAALTAPSAMALVILLFAPGAARNGALGLMGAMAGLGGASGAIVGGLLTEAFGWPAILWLNVPIGLGVVGLSFWVLPSIARGSASLDLGGAVTVTLGVVALVCGLVEGADGSWSGYSTLVPLVAAALLLVLFVVVERHTREPLLPLPLLGIRTLRGANATVFLSAMAMMPMWFLLTVYLQQVRGYGPVGAGVGVLPTVAMLVALNSLAPRLFARVGTRTLLVAGLLVAAVGVAWMSRLEGSRSGFAADLLGPELVVGLGFGLSFVAATVTATVDVPGERAGVASGVYSSAQQVGGAVGLALLVAAAGRTAGGDPVALTADLAQAFRLSAGFALAAAVAALLLVPPSAPAQRPPRFRPDVRPAEPSTGLATRGSKPPGAENNQAPSAA